MDDTISTIKWVAGPWKLETNTTLIAALAPSKFYRGKLDILQE